MSAAGLIEPAGDGSALLPLVAGRPVEFRGRRLIDGGVTEPIPARSAAGLGATHAIVLATRPVGTAPRRTAGDLLVEAYLQRLNPALRQAYRARPARYRSIVDALRTGRDPHLPVSVVIAPALSDPIPSRLERDSGAIRRARDAALETAHH